MATDTDLMQIVDSLRILEGRFVESRSNGLYLSTQDEAEFKRLTLEAKAMLDSELSFLNGFSSSLNEAIKSGSGSSWGDISITTVQNARATVQGGINQIRRKIGSIPGKPQSNKPFYVATSRINELRSLVGRAWDVTRLVRLTEELNIANANDCNMSIAMLVRAIVDHVPPIFSCKNFDEVANNYSGSKSFKGSMQHLNNSLRNIADSHLHQQIRQSEVLPAYSQVDFSADLDVLLAEVVRKLK